MMEEANDESQSTTNPLYHRNTTSLKSTTTNYTLPNEDVGKHLEQELMEGIVHLSDRTRQRGSLEREFQLFREAASRHPQSQPAYTLLLFRKYSEVANDIKDRVHNDRHLHGQTGIALLDDLQQSFSSYSYEEDVHEISGWNAMSSYIFWIRFFTAIFAFLAMVIMSSVPYVGVQEFAPSHAFYHNCPYMVRDFFIGTFDMQPYQLIISVGVITYLYSFVMALYFMLPVNTSKRKFILALTWLLGRFIDSQERIEEIADYLATCCRGTGARTLLLCDAVVLALLMTAVLIASISVERSFPFIVGVSGSIEYYTLGSFYMTYQHTHPPCVKSNPCPTLRASLAMAYFATMIQVLSFYRSYQGYLIERKTRESRSNLHLRTLQSIPGENDVVEIDMRALPVPTRGDDDLDQSLDQRNRNPSPQRTTVYDEASV